MRSKGRTDNNQESIIEDLRACGMSVAVTSGLGGGFPDILVGRAGHNFLFEIKNPDVDKTHRKLTPDENEWHVNWRGGVSIVQTSDQIIDIINGAVRQ